MNWWIVPALVILVAQMGRILYVLWRRRRPPRETGGLSGCSCPQRVDDRGLVARGESVMAKSDEEPAFPRPYADGMSLRDYFAGQALAGTLAAEPEDEAFDYKYSAVAAYKYADAMLAEREK
jgi:hypothetical protein